MIVGSVCTLYVVETIENIQTAVIRNYNPRLVSHHKRILGVRRSMHLHRSTDIGYKTMDTICTPFTVD